MRMPKLGCCLLLTWVALTVGASAEIVKFDVIPAYAPKGPDSPNWNAYVNNALLGIQAGTDIGTRLLDPAAYEIVDHHLTPYEIVYTNFPSWQGSADPSQTFSDLPPMFQGERGNRVHFGTHIVSKPDWPFALDQISWSLDSNDVDHYFDQAGTFSGHDYSRTRIGINYGNDGVKNTGDDVVYNNGESGQNEIHEFVYVGIGDGFGVFDSGLFPTDQLEIDDTLATIVSGCSGCPVKLTGTYTINNPNYDNPVIAHNYIDIITDPGFGGDFDRDGEIDCDDADLLTWEVASGANNVLFDLTGDSQVNFHDIHAWVVDIANTYFGDVNCDGEFNSTDLVKVFQKGKYETGLQAAWTEGDWNGDHLFDSGDLVIAFQDGGYETGPRQAVSANAVPEPSSMVLVLIGLATVIGRRRSR